VAAVRLKPVPSRAEQQGTALTRGRVPAQSASARWWSGLDGDDACLDQEAVVDVQQAEGAAGLAAAVGR
jgi:hypothetical protein